MCADCECGLGLERLDALEELVFVLAHGLGVESPQVARAIAHRLKLHGGVKGVSDETRRLLRSVGRMLDMP